MHGKVDIAISTVTDGTMKATKFAEIEQTVLTTNRSLFLRKYGKDQTRCVRVQLDYDTDDFCRYHDIDESAAGEGVNREGRIADGLATRASGLTLMLPLADCIGAVIYDPDNNVLMLSHLGRQNLEQYGGTKSIEFLSEQYGSDPKHLQIVTSPAAGGDNYPLFAFEHRSLQDEALRQLMEAGVQKENVTLSSIDTTKDPRYYSHSEFLKGNQKTDGRFMIIATLR